MKTITQSLSDALAEETCEPCQAGCRPLAKKETLSLLPSVPGWTLAKREGVMRLEKEFVFHDFSAALAFANKLGETANREDHHPAMVVEWGLVKVSWWTHKVKGLHRNDFVCAAKTDAIFDY